MPRDAPDASRGVFLASLPLSSAQYPSLALGLLKSAVTRIGVTCDVRYFSLDYLQEVGSAAFYCLSDADYYTALVGEWVFAAALDRDGNTIDAEDARYLREVFRKHCPQREYVSRLLMVLEAREVAAAFIDRCVDQIDWTRYAILGLSTSFQQNMASLAFARRVKERFPHVYVVFGGANCQGEMGTELHRRHGFIDAVCLGEGDEVFPELVRRHVAGFSKDDLPGIVLRAADGTSVPPLHEVRQVEDLDALPYPDLSDFYHQRQSFPVASATLPSVVFETARGCWWGAKHHCTFCGLNGRMMAYRSKSQGRAHAELAHLAAHYGNDIVNADAILDMRYFEEFLPRLAAEGPAVSMFWQMKANLRPDQVALLARAGITSLQPGIEALDSELLRLMKKGCTMLQNVQILKLSAEHGMRVAWNLLYGFPGESPSSYVRAARIMPMLRHLQPPMNAGPVLADRFSPYFQRPGSFSIDIEPAAAYGFVYRYDDVSVRRLAYHFRMRSDALDHAAEIAAPMLEQQQLWSEHLKDSALYVTELGDTLAVIDERWGWQPTTHTLEGAAAKLLRLCWRITPWHQIQSNLNAAFAPETLRRAAEDLIERGLLLEEDDTLLALPLRQPGWRRARTAAEIAAAQVASW